MNDKPRLLLVGNFLSQHIGTRGVCEDLAERLSAAGYAVVRTSSRLGRAARLADMMTTIVLRRAEYDLAYLEVYSGLAFLWAEICAWLLTLLRKPVLLVLHGGGLPDFAKQHPVRVRRLLQRAASVCTPSRLIAEQFAAIRNDIQYLPNAIDLSSYVFRLRNRPRPRLVWLRAFHAIYEPELAVKVLAEISNEARGAELVMIGPDKHDGSLERTQALAAELGLQNQVTFRGAIQKKNVPSELNDGDIFLNTTRYESFGISVVEAAACGLTVVSTNVGELGALWRDGETALLVEPGDARTMGASVRRVLNENGLSGRLSRCGREQAEKFDWTLVLPQWERLIHETLHV